MTWEKVDHPKHYQSQTLEAIDVIEAFALNFSLGSAVKYILRAGRKPGERAAEDLKKAAWYLRREAARLEMLVAEQERLEQEARADIFRPIEDRANDHPLVPTPLSYVSLEDNTPPVRLNHKD